MKQSVRKILIQKGISGSVEARRQTYLAITAIRFDMKTLRKRWTRRQQILKTESMLYRHAREADAAGFPDDQKTLARAAFAVSEALA